MLDLCTFDQCSICINQKLSSGSFLGGSDSLLLHLLGITDNLIGSTLYDAAGLWKLGADAHEVSINVASCLTTFVDAPGYR